MNELEMVCTECAETVAASHRLAKYALLGVILLLALYLERERRQAEHERSLREELTVGHDARNELDDRVTALEQRPPVTAPAPSVN